MNLNEPFPVSASKKEALLQKIEALNIDVGIIKEAFLTGGGKGGQKINKTANAVRLTYPPLEISVRVQKERSRSLNRFLALRELVEKIEMRVSPSTSSRKKAWDKKRKQKARRRRKRNMRGATEPREAGDVEASYEHGRGQG